MWKKKIAGFVISIIAVFSIMTGCAKTSTDENVVKILNNKESLCLAPVHIAIINGYFDEEFKAIGQKYEIVVSNIDTITEQISSGEINAGYGLTGTLMQPIANGLGISFVTGLHRGCTKFYTKNGSETKSLEDLKGKTIGVSSLSDSAPIQLKRKLYGLGFNVNGSKADIQFATYAMTDLLAALDNGAVDAIGIHDPVAYRAEKNYDFIKILDIGEDEVFSKEYCCQAYVSQELIQKNTAGAVAYAKAIQKAAAFVQACPEEAARLQVENGYMPSENADDVVKYGEILSGLNYQPSVSLGKETFVASFKDLQKTGDINPDLSLDAFVKKVYPDLEGIPDSVLYDKEHDKFEEIR
ncbi:ABC transporter substrate-binding protein [[Clostridium] polysaccharolyticum]|uniref:NitT/TauT family transport system substrate-binding protein n=1 Tax=[Clostridium] polysaccharolyticum TaxID=29364 RepID=A0A1I0AD28_9FIRM|nr:ABC transporter substrate-binding protein [[Clostridium] polysaccharolyticum]SES91177.1 NitT/TauT family transport system substrate-binding protein [[Clostridium] polysaccharolyticum]